MNEFAPAETSAFRYLGEAPDARPVYRRPAWTLELRRVEMLILTGG